MTVVIPNNTWTYVSGLDIDDILATASPAQNASSTFQMRFGQQDNSFAPGDGMTIDEITIEDLSKSAQANMDTDSLAMTNRDGFQAFSNDGNVYIQSFGKAKDEEKTVYIYDSYGKEIMRKDLEPSMKDKIIVNYANEYIVAMVVKIVSKNYVTVEKVFIDMK